ncbi:MAG: hypothetical protein RIS35_222, partial [Pseudomonadota bacterium]
MQRNRILKAALISTALSIAAAGANAQ